MLDEHPPDSLDLCARRLHVLFMFQSQVQVVDAAMARALHQDAARSRALVAWIVLWDDPAFPDRFIAQLATATLLPYVLVGDTLGAVRAQLPPGLERSEWEPADSPEVIEIWFTP